MRLWRYGPDYVVATTVEEVYVVLRDCYGSEVDLDQLGSYLLIGPIKSLIGGLSVEIDEIDRDPLPDGYKGQKSMKRRPDGTWVAGPLVVTSTVESWLAITNKPCILASEEW